jgi:hypothetical protein
VIRYRFAEVSSALHEHWGLALYRGGAMGDGKHDGRWDVTYSRTGFVVYGDLPGRGHGGLRYKALAQVVTSCSLAEVIKQARRPCSKTARNEQSTRSTQ